MENHIRQFMNDMGLDSFDDIGFLYQDYINECDVMINAIDANIETTSASELEKQIHNLKGVSANLYVQPVHQIAESLDSYLKDHLHMTITDLEIQSLWTQLRSSYNKATDEIIIFFAKHSVSITH